MSDKIKLDGDTYEESIANSSGKSSHMQGADKELSYMYSLIDAATAASRAGNQKECEKYIGRIFNNVEHLVTVAKDSSELTEKYRRAAYFNGMNAFVMQYRYVRHNILVDNGLRDLGQVVSGLDEYFAVARMWTGEWAIVYLDYKLNIDPEEYKKLKITELYPIGTNCGHIIEDLKKNFGLKQLPDISRKQFNEVFKKYNINELYENTKLELFGTTQPHEFKDPEHKSKSKAKPHKSGNAVVFDFIKP